MRTTLRILAVGSEAGARRWPRRVAVGAALALLGFVFVAFPSMAQGPELHILLAATEQTSVGQRAEVVARVVDMGGAPLEGIPVTFLVDLSFLNVADLAVIGRAVTDEDGVARLHYVPKSDGTLTVVARVEDEETGALYQATTTMEVLPGPPTFRPPSPVRIPGANVWLVVTVLGIVWSLYLWMAWTLIRIAAVSGAGSEEGRHG